MPPAPTRLAPASQGVVSRKPASRAGFNYSDSMKAFGSANEAWTYEMIDAYLTNPKTEVPGNKMAFAGLKKPDERANVVPTCYAFGRASAAALSLTNDLRIGTAANSGSPPFCCQVAPSMAR